MGGMKIGSLFSGYGGLDMGVRSVLGGSVAWHAEIDQAPSAILEHHYPGVPNIGDVSAVDWSTVEPVDVLTGGFPCQDLSLAGARRGLRPGTRSGLWSMFAEAIDVLRPGLVVIENVRGILSAEAHSDLEPCPWCLGVESERPPLRALGAVLGSLAELGYDARWCGLRAADAGAPHARFRVFVVAYPVGWEPERWGVNRILDGATRAGAGEGPERQRVRDASLDIRAAENADLATRGERWISAPGQAEGGRARSDARGRGRALAADSGRFGGDEGFGDSELGAEVADGAGVAHERGARPGGPEWGPYAPAIERWQGVLGRVAPAPTNPDGKGGAHRLAPEFVEWMMGLPSGHVTSPDIGISRNAQLKALGNGVVPQQAAMALRMLLPEPHDSGREGER